jgi:hypothetical protein
MASQTISQVLPNPHPDLAEILERFEDTSRRHAAQLDSWPEKEWARVGQLRIADRVALDERQVTSFGCSTSMRSIIGASFPPTYGLWVQRSQPFMARRVTQGSDRDSREVHKSQINESYGTRLRSEKLFGEYRC